jgi:nucleotide-binding universal stress UspA family protein
MSAIRSIIHPTDCSEICVSAFVHALRMTLLAKCKLDIVYVLTQQDVTRDLITPRIRHTLSLWGLAGKTDPPSNIGEKLNIEISKIRFSAEDAASGLLDYVRHHPSDLLVFATHGRDGLDRWMHGSVSESVALRAVTPTLFFPPDARGFVDALSGEIFLKRILLPIDHSPPLRHAFRKIAGFLDLFEQSDMELRPIHIGTSIPAIASQEAVGEMGSVDLLSGNPIDVILEEADEWEADLIIMPTAGHHGFSDAINGSTSERVLRHAPCPVLTIPARQ